MSRGYKNRNPGNLISGGSMFVGEIPSADSRFRTFRSMDWGFRAMIKVIQNYIKAGNDTITKIITRYAPPNENDTPNYIHFVSSHSGIDPDQILSAEDQRSILALVFAMATIENGEPPQLSDVHKGWDLLRVFRIPGSEDPGSSGSPVTLPSSEIKKKTNHLPILLLISAGLITISLIYANRKKVDHRYSYGR